VNKRLGRGLDFLLSEKPEAEEASSVAEIDVGKVSSNPWQPRTEFPEGELEELTRSIRKMGVMQPIVVRRKTGGGFELIAGERRLLAARRARLKAIPAVVRDLSDQEMLIAAIIENVVRSDLGAVEKARAFRRLSDEQHLSHQDIATAVGVARSTVTNTLRLLELDEDILAALSAGKIREGHARTLLSEADPSARRNLFRDMLAGSVTVREAEAKVRPAGRKKSRGRRSSEAAVLEKKLSESLGMPVAIQENGNRGKVVIRYRNLEEFDELHRRITGRNPEL